MLHLAPNQVLPLSEAGPGKERRFKIRGLREGWAWAPRSWIHVTRDTGVGDPSGSSAEAGEAFLKAVAERIGAFLVELAEADLEDLYE